MEIVGLGRNCKYSIEGLGEDIPKAPTQEKESKFLGQNTNSLKKLDLYMEKNTMWDG